MDTHGADSKRSRTSLFRINWECEPSEYAENPVNWSFLRQLEVRLLLFTACTCV